MEPKNSAPLAGVRVVEFAGIGPGPFAAMMLADMGADVIRIEKPKNHSNGSTESVELDFLSRGRQSIALDLKASGATDVALQIIENADALIEGYRPGVMERLGLGPDDCHAINPKLVYGRMTGWGQEGPLAQRAGHDLNYIAISGALWAMGEADRAPVFPLNLLGDFGGGGMYLAFGILAGLLKAAATGRGSVVDAAIVDGTASLLTMLHSHRATGKWRDARAVNSLDGGAPWYSVYECADGGWITIAALEPQFWAILLERLDLSEEDLGDRADRSCWPAMRDCLKKVFRSKSRDEWVAILQDCDACFAPVLSPGEAALHPHNAARGVFSGSQAQPMPAPRFGSSSLPLPGKPPVIGQNSCDILKSSGFSELEISEIFSAGIVF